VKQGRSTMTTRREFIFAAAAVAAMLTRISSALAATYDLVIKGGRVIDPAARINAMRDVAIVGGRIAAIESNIAADGAQTLDARGKLVVPGLIDVHTHAARAREMAAICLADGVTGFVDAGSAGADKIDDVVANAKSAPNRGDIVTHMYAPEPNSILDGNGRLFPEVVEARRRGIWFDVGNGRNGHLWWDVAERALKQGFMPDTISTDWTTEGRASGVIGFPNCLSKFLMLGMPLDRVIACG